MNRVTKKCKFCGKPISVEAKHKRAEVSHMSCLHRAVKPVRDGLKK